MVDVENSNQIKIKTNPAEYIVGIGSSAGSLSALKDFFSSIDKDTKAAFILVQHLSPDFKSIMDEILVKHCPLPIHLAKDLQIIECGNLYILEERKYISLGDGKILLSDIIQEKLHHPIDYFFKSLAEEYQNRAYGVILSGTGSDGANGIVELHNIGARVYCQSPKDAEFDGMPINALETGLIDQSTSASGLGVLITKHIKNRSTSEPSFSQSQKNLTFLEKIFELVRQSSNIDFREYKLRTAERRIQHRMGVLEIKDFRNYYDYVMRENQELSLLTSDMLIGVTQFFRDPEVWDYLLEHVVKPLILEKEDGQTIRVWVPGCASGEEAYTISMLFEYAQEKLNTYREVRIFGSDIGRKDYRDSNPGTFDKRVEKDIPEPYLSRYFKTLNDKLVLNEDVHNRVVFTTHNVAFDPPFSSMDMISCRNLLIYFQPSAQKRILSYFHFSLQPEGHLVLGVAETIGTLSEYYHTVESKLRVYKKNSETRISLSDAGLKSHTISNSSSKFSQPTRFKTHLNNPTIDTLKPSNISRIKELLIDTYVPPTFVIDGLHNIIYSFGDTQAYTKKIKPGLASLHITNQLHGDVVSTVNAIIKKLEDTRTPVRIDNLIMLPEGIKTTIEGSCIIKHDDNKIENFIISFVEMEPVTDRESEEEKRFRRESQLGQQVSRLNADLIDAREIIVERQQDISQLAEELQCSNEELMAANEELQSSNEELQSVNEELFTVNSEYQDKIKELETANFDLDNLLKYTEMGVIYLDAHLLIRRFTPKARDFLNILPLDLNRPFMDLSLTFKGANVNTLIHEASRDKAHRKAVYPCEDGPDIELTINPYLSRHDQLEGIILVFRHLIAGLGA